MLKKLIFAFILLLTSTVLLANGEPKITRQQYIDQWKNEAVKQMQEHQIPASITLAQAILESSDGNSFLARKANNHFGIKCHDWTGKKVYKDDDAKDECFRSYRSATESFEDHSIFLKRSRYAFLFEYKITDYKSWAKGLKKAGYATNPRYPDLLIRIIEENNLHQYDILGAKGKRKNEEAIASGKPAGNSRRNGKEIIVTIGGKEAEVFVSDNEIKYTIAKTATTPEKLANDLNMGRWQIAKYNDLSKTSRIKEGDLIYLQPKRNKSRNFDTHTVLEGETLREISQRYGVKMKKIRKFSDLSKDYQPKTGDVLKLRR